MDDKILVPVDGSETSARTIAFILAHRERFPVPLTLLHVVPLDRLAYRMIPDFQVEMVRENAGKAGRHLAEDLAARLREGGLQVEVRLEFGSPREVIPSVANDGGYQLLVIGRRGTGEIRDVLFGSVTNHVLHKVRLPVLLI